MTGITKKQLKNGKEKYIVRAYANKKQKYLGTFYTIESARYTRQEFLKEHKKQKIIKEINDTNNQDWRQTNEYRHWQIKCIRRDKVCQLCGSRKGRNVHHLKNGHDHPKYRFDVNNGITLCRACHTAFHCSYKKSFREKCNENDWNNFIELLNYFKDKKLIYFGESKMVDKKVLIIDDSKVMCKINANVAKEAGINEFNIDIAFNGQEGIDKFKIKDYNLVLCDINMPVKNGFEFISEARELKSKEKCGIFMCTTEGGKEEVIKALKLGANNYLVKPLDKDNLVQKIKEFFGV